MQCVANFRLECKFQPHRCGITDNQFLDEIQAHCLGRPIKQTVRDYDKSTSIGCLFDLTWWDHSWPGMFQNGVIPILDRCGCRNLRKAYSRWERYIKPPQ